MIVAAAEVAAAPTITVESPISFGQVYADPNGGTITLKALAGGSYSTSVSINSISKLFNPSVGVIRINQNPVVVNNFVVPASVTLSCAGGPDMTVSDIALNSFFDECIPTPSGSECRVYLGGALDVSGASVLTTPCNYSGTVTIDVIYP